MSTGLERAPISFSGVRGEWSGRHRESAVALHQILKHDVRIGLSLAIGKSNQFVAGPEELAARRKQLDQAKQVSHVVNRGMHQLGILLIGTISQMEAEFRRRDTLDIGCGNGQFGTEIARKAKAKVTFLDTVSEVFSNLAPRSGKRVVADGVQLPFKDETFSRTVSSFSSITWADTPRQTVMALHEALRVTRRGGSLIAPAIMTGVMSRALLSNDDPSDQAAYKVWAVQDHVLLRNLNTLTEEGLCSITWSGYLGSGQNSGGSLEIYSAIIDKHKPIPQELVDDNLLYAAQFVA